MIDRLREKIAAVGAPIVLGMDPMLSFIPERIKRPVFAEAGETLEAAAACVIRFQREIIDATADLIPCIKPQIAMYEQFGLPGLAAFKDCVDVAHEKGLLVIGDVKRGDIGSTSAAYATAHLGRVMVGDQELSPFDEDFATVNPYLGTDGIAPFLDVCEKADKGVFVLVKTSNPSSGEFQDREIDGKPLYIHVAEKVAAWAEEHREASGYSKVGAVTGATYPGVAEALRKVMPKSFFLVPGYGAQGGTAEDLRPFFNADGEGAIVNSSRGIIAAWQSETYKAYGDDFAEAARASVLDMRNAIRKVLDQ